MSTTLKLISKKAFDKLAAKLTGVVFTGTLTKQTKGAYNRTTGSYDAPTDATHSCRVLVAETPTNGLLGTYTVSEKEKVLIVEGLTVVPVENDKLDFNGDTKTVTFVDDILDAGEFFQVVAR